MKITAQMIKELRERTGAPMMQVKAALEETEGSIDDAIQLLRKKGLAAAAKKAGHNGLMEEGVVAAALGVTSIQEVIRVLKS